ncbi:MAG: molybdopterin-guanine dinucleotide biosynthesis protein B [Geminicoccaceae bacterium]
MKKIFGIVGWKNSGKTTLMVKLIERFTAEGLIVASLKHAQHQVDNDQPGRDSFRHREAGASQVALVTARRVMIVEELGNRAEPTIDEVIARLQPADLYLIEGFKTHPHLKIEVRAEDCDQPLLAATDPNIRAIAADLPMPNCGRPRFDRDDIEGIARFIRQQTGLIREAVSR